MNAQGQGLATKDPAGEPTATGADDDREAGTAIVAVVLEWRNRVGLFKRSHTVGHDQGRWHCITGYLEDGRSPEEQALDELMEETGLRVPDLTGFSRGRPLLLEDSSGGRWAVHTFKARTERRRLQINEEHEKYRWVSPRTVRRYSNCVGWLDDVLSAVEAQ